MSIWNKSISFSFIIFYCFFSPTNTLAQKTLSTNLNNEIANDEFWSVAQHQRKKNQKRRQTTRHKKRNSESKTYKSRPSTKASPGVKLGGGFVMGADGDTPILLAGDYVHPWSGKNNLNFVAGGNYWSYSAFGESLKFITIEGGLEYQHALNTNGSLIAGARLTHVYLSSSLASDSKIGFTILGGYEHKISTNAIGVEFRIPIVSKLDVNYLLFYYKFNLY